MLEVAGSSFSSRSVFLCLSVFVSLLDIFVSGDLLPNNPAFQQHIFSPNDVKFWFKHLLVLLWGMPCMASAKSTMIVFPTVEETHRDTLEAVSWHQAGFKQV